MPIVDIVAMQKLRVAASLQYLVKQDWHVVIPAAPVVWGSLVRDLLSASLVAPFPSSIVEFTRPEGSSIKTEFSLLLHSWLPRLSAEIIKYVPFSTNVGKLLTLNADMPNLSESQKESRLQGWHPDHFEDYPGIATKTDITSQAKLLPNPGWLPRMVYLPGYGYLPVSSMSTNPAISNFEVGKDESIFSLNLETIYLTPDMLGTEDELTSALKIETGQHGAQNSQDETLPLGMNVSRIAILQDPVTDTIGSVVGTTRGIVAALGDRTKGLELAEQLNSLDSTGKASNSEKARAPGVDPQPEEEVTDSFTDDQPPPDLTGTPDVKEESPVSQAIVEASSEEVEDSDAT